MIHPKVLSTIHRFGRTAKPVAPERLTICNRQAPVRRMVSAISSGISAISKNAFDEQVQSAGVVQQGECAIDTQSHPTHPTQEVSGSALRRQNVKPSELLVSA